MATHAWSSGTACRNQSCSGRETEPLGEHGAGGSGHARAPTWRVAWVPVFWAAMRLVSAAHPSSLPHAGPGPAHLGPGGQGGSAAILHGIEQGPGCPVISAVEKHFLPLLTQTNFTGFAH